MKNIIKIKKIELPEKTMKAIEKLAIDKDLSDQKLIGDLLLYCIVNYHTLGLSRYLNENNN